MKRTGRVRKEGTFLASVVMTDTGGDRLRVAKIHRDLPNARFAVKAEQMQAQLAEIAKIDARAQ